MIAIKRKRKKAQKKLYEKEKLSFNLKIAQNQIDLKIKANYQEKNKIEVENLKENQNEFLKNDRLILIAINQF